MTRAHGHDPGRQEEYLQGMARERRRLRRLARLALAGMLLGALCVPLGAFGLGPVPHIFSAGDPIAADEMNENFAHLQDAITALEGTVAGLAMDVPSGGVMLFDLANCPSGWSEVEEARGRALVGLTGSAGTLRGTVGDALTDMEDRPHGHAVDIAAFDSANSSVAHTHSIPAAITGEGGAHNHQWWAEGQSFASSGVSLPVPPFPASVGSGTTVPNTWSANLYTDNEDPHTHSIAARTSGNASNTSHSHAVNPPSTPSGSASTSAVLPYVQLLVCRRD